MIQITADEIHKAVAWAASSGETWHPARLDKLLADYLGGTVTKRVENGSVRYFREAPVLRRVK